ncbi:hypothetical protein [Paraburkholderia sediminicola]|uniref:hypothetical protein n=1 Tax=Paraburkholderia sediminicola TaxID=458836 RepID=UPI0038BD795E
MNEHQRGKNDQVRPDKRPVRVFVISREPVKHVQSSEAALHYQAVQQPHQASVSPPAF